MIVFSKNQTIEIKQKERKSLKLEIKKKKRSKKD
jgi:hypothetical protein